MRTLCFCDGALLPPCTPPRHALANPCGPLQVLSVQSTPVLWRPGLSTQTLHVPAGSYMGWGFQWGSLDPLCPLPPHLIFVLQLDHLWGSLLSLCPNYGYPRSRAALWCGVSRAWALTWLRLRCVIGQWPPSTLPGVPVFICSLWVESKSLTGILLASVVLQQDKRVCFYISVLWKDAYILSGSPALFLYLSSIILLLICPLTSINSYIKFCS